MGTRESQHSVLSCVSVGSENVLRVWHESRTWEKEAASAYWHNYYRLFRAAHPNPRIAAGVFCALSPNNGEKSNWRDMIDLLASHKEGRADTCTVHTYGSNKRKAIRILGGEPIDSVITAPKTNSMFHNMTDPNNPNYVTIDGHMVSVWQGKRITMDNAGISKKEYRFLADCFIGIADGLGILPNVLQAAVWMAWKRQHRILYNPQLSLDFEG